jgi:hypothetical protein
MAGSIALTTSDLGGGVTKYSIAWTSDASGNVNGSSLALKRGRLLQVKFVPTNGGTEPSNDYSVTLLDADGVDVLAGKGASLSNTAASIAVPVVSSTSPAFIDPTLGNFTPTVSAAGNVTNGRIDLLIGPG